MPQPDILAITEANAKNSRYAIQSVELCIEGYDCFSMLRGRGIILWIRSGISASLYTFDCAFEDSLWVTIQLKNNDQLLLGCIYRSPNSTAENTELMNLLMEKAASEGFSHLLICGDFNFPNIDWENNFSSDPAAQQFLNTCDEVFLHQHVLKPTRARSDQRPHILDLVFSNEENMVVNMCYESPLGKSDHACLIFDFLCYVEKNCSSRTFTLYRKGNFQAMRQHFNSINWQTELEGHTSVQEMYDKFLLIFQQACTDFIPTRTFDANTKKRRSGLTTGDVAVIKKKHRAWTRFMESRTEERHREYTKLRNKVKTITRKATRNYEKNIAKSVKEEPKKFWSYIKSKTKVKERIPDLMVDSNRRTSNDKEKAETLSSFFTSVFTTEPPGDVPPPVERSFASALTDITIVDADIERLLQKLKPGKSMGPDNIHPAVLKEVASSIAQPLGIIYRKSLLTGELPSQWKQASISAIYKKGDKHQPNNYRPVSLTSVPCKVFESIIRTEIISHMMTNSLLNTCQYGFVERRSTTLQLLHTLEEWVRCIDNSDVIDVCYLDLMKAFDSVPHRRLIEKVHSYGIRGNILKWIVSFLTERNQCVRVNGETSTCQKVVSGVPQGSVLGPVLFVLYINDMPEIVTSNIKLYADDAKLYRPVIMPRDEEALQGDIFKLEEWSSRWLLRFHPEKCTMMRVGKKEKARRTYHMHNDGSQVALKWEKEEKDLGGACR